MDVWILGSVFYLTSGPQRQTWGSLELYNVAISNQSINQSISLPFSSQFSVCACNEMERRNPKSLSMQTKALFQLNTQVQGMGTQLHGRVFAWYVRGLCSVLSAGGESKFKERQGERKFKGLTFLLPSPWPPVFDRTSLRSLWLAWNSM